MELDEGYQDARRLLKARYGQSYKIATAVSRVKNGPPIRHEDGSSAPEVLGPAHKLQKIFQGDRLPQQDRESGKLTEGSRKA